MDYLRWETSGVKVSKIFAVLGRRTELDEVVEDLGLRDEIEMKSIHAP